MFRVCCFVGDDWLWGVDRRRGGTADTLVALESIRAARSDGAPVCVILDNLSAHAGVDFRCWVKKNKVELCFTSTYASWGNPVEARFGLLRQFALANSHYRSPSVQAQALHRYLCWCNATVRHPGVLAAQRRECVRIRSEKGIRLGGCPLAGAV